MTQFKKNLIKIAKCLLHPFEGKDGKLSGRRILAFFFAYCVFVKDYDADQLLIIAGLIGTMFGFTTWQNVAMMKKSEYSDSSSNTDEPK